VDIYISDDEKYYDYFDYTVYRGAGKSHIVPAPLEKIPLLMQGGHIIPRKDRPRRSSALMKWDPYTLVVVLSKDDTADGTLYVDDGETFDFQRGAYIHRRFSFSNSTLFSEDIGTKGPKTGEYLKAMAGVRVEKVVIVGAPHKWQDKSRVKVIEEGVKERATAPLSYYAPEGQKTAYSVVKNPNVSIGRTWRIEF
jgi:mannosyl-oligosaccharide alpha-1,3-glucosidase